LIKKTEPHRQQRLPANIYVIYVGFCTPSGMLQCTSCGLPVSAQCYSVSCLMNTFVLSAAPAGQLCELSPPPLRDLGAPVDLFPSLSAAGVSALGLTHMDSFEGLGLSDDEQQQEQDLTHGLLPGRNSAAGADEAWSPELGPPISAAAIDAAAAAKAQLAQQQMPPPPPQQPPQQQQSRTRPRADASPARLARFSTASTDSGDGGPGAPARAAPGAALMGPGPHVANGPGVDGAAEAAPGRPLRKTAAAAACAWVNAGMSDSEDSA
jgi:hypothetical protein